jgi:hypothetical protein
MYLATLIVSSLLLLAWLLSGAAHAYAALMEGLMNREVRRLVKEAIRYFPEL